MRAIVWVKVREKESICVRVWTELREPDRVRVRVSHQRDQKREIDIRKHQFALLHFGFNISNQKKTKPSSSRCSRSRRCETKTKKASHSFFLFLSERPQKLRIENWRGTISCFVFFYFLLFLLVGCESPSSHQQPTNSAAIEPKRKATVILAFKIFLDKKKR